jgi:hypothetical protein
VTAYLIRWRLPPPTAYPTLELEQRAEGRSRSRRIFSWLVADTGRQTAHDARDRQGRSSRLASCSCVSIPERLQGTSDESALQDEQTKVSGRRVRRPNSLFLLDKWSM